MKEAIDLIFFGTEQLRGVPPTFLDHKNKNDFHVQGTFNFKWTIHGTLGNIQYLMEIAGLVHFGDLLFIFCTEHSGLSCVPAKFSIC